MYEPDFKIIGEKLRERRKFLGMTQEQVADAANVNVSHISNIEHNKVKISLSLLIRICQILDTTVDYILANEFPHATSTIDNELMNVLRDLSDEQKELLLRIAKVL